MADAFTERFPPSITAARLYERTSAKGNTYMTGRMGGVRVALLKTNETDDEGHPIWELRFSSAPAKAKDKPADADNSRSDHQAPPPMRQQRQATKPSARSFDQPAGPNIDDEIPF